MESTFIFAAGYFSGVLFMLLRNPNRHCWLKLRRHTVFWRPGLHRLYEYPHCTACHRPLIWPAMRELEINK